MGSYSINNLVIMKTIKSKQGTLQGRDWIKSFGIGAVTAILYALYELWQASGSIDAISWKQVGTAAVTALIAYIGKNLFEPSKVVTVHAEGKEARKIISAKGDGPQNPPPFGDPTHPKP